MPHSAPKKKNHLTKISLERFACLPGGVLHKTRVFCSGSRCPSVNCHQEKRKAHVTYGILVPFLEKERSRWKMPSHSGEIGNTPCKGDLNKSNNIHGKNSGEKKGAFPWIQKAPSGGGSYKDSKKARK